MPIDYPSNPTLNQSYSFNGRSWIWDGNAWSLTSVGIIGATGATGSTGPIGAIGATGPGANIAIESINLLTGSTGIVVHNYNLGGLFLHSGVVANFTANFTNVPTTNNSVVTFTLVIYQGATPYYPSAVQIDGVAQTIKWADNTTPGPNASKTEIASFSLIRVSSAWTVIGSYSTYG